jgi:hypothetical protein
MIMRLRWRKVSEKNMKDEWDVIEILTDDVVASIDGQAAWARAHKISAQYLNDVLHGRREPGPKILQAIGFEKVVTYRPVEVKK